MVLTASEIVLEGRSSGDDGPGAVDPIGEGSYAVVYQGDIDPKYSNRKFDKVAIKCLKYLTGSVTQKEKGFEKRQVRSAPKPVLYATDVARKQMFLEIVNMWTIRHEHVMTLVGASFAYGPLSLVLPWMPNGTVDDCVLKMKNKVGSGRKLVDSCNVLRSQSVSHGVFNEDLSEDFELV